MREILASVFVICFTLLTFTVSAGVMDSLPEIEVDSNTVSIDTLISELKGDSSTLLPLENLTDSLPDSLFPEDLPFDFAEASKQLKKKQEKEVKEEKAEKVLDPEMIHARNAAILGIIPGGGQIYNKRWWKLPIVYGILGGASWFVYNSATEMRRYNRALDLRLESQPDEFLGILSDQQVVANRNFYRRNLQLGAVAFTALWGLSIVDAVVDAHMKTYDIGDNLTLKFKPNILRVDNKSVPSFTLKFTL